jgi:glucan phosphoethanolaminetransferase (alkaline phosphatase superfamily)
MTDVTVGALIAVAILLLSLPYAVRARHPSTKPLAAYLIFTTVFVVVGFVVFAILVWIGNAIDVLQHEPNPIAGIVLAILVVVPAFLVARRQIRKPPKQPPPLHG